MGRKRSNEERPATTTRIYGDTLRILKLLAEAQDMTLMDYVDRLARRAITEDGGKVQSAMDEYQGQDAPPTKKGR